MEAQVREWICSRDIGTVNASDVISNFRGISMEMVEDIMERLLKDDIRSRASKDVYAVNKITDPKTPHMNKDDIMQNVSQTEGTKNNNSDLMYMKTRHLLRIAIYNICYIRGLFPEKYFIDKSIPELGMKIKKLIPNDA